MNLEKRDCGIQIKLFLRGASWAKVLVDFGEGEMEFHISSAFGGKDRGFQLLIRSLYFLYPDVLDNEEGHDVVEYKYGIYKYINSEYILAKVCDSLKEETFPLVEEDIPWKASFRWIENLDGEWYSDWTIERIPNEDKSFDVTVHIITCRNEKKEYDCTVKYEDLCYAVADAATKVLKEHGLTGYHRATYTEDINIRQLLFIKAIALRNTEACELTFYSDETDRGETSDFSKELKLLLFDM